MGELNGVDVFGVCVWCMCWTEVDHIYNIIRRGFFDDDLGMSGV